MEHGDRDAMAKNDPKERKIHVKILTRRRKKKEKGKYFGNYEKVKRRKGNKKKGK